MNRITAILALAIGVLSLAQAGQEEAVKYYTLKSGRAYYHVVVADLRNRDLSVETVLSKKAKSFWDLAKPDVPTIAMTGTFFNPADSQPVGDVIIDGQRVARGSRGSVFAIDWEGQPHIFDTGFNRSWNYIDYRFALRAAVRLVRDGKVCPDPKSQKFRDPRIWGRASRTAAGITDDGRLVFMATRSGVTLRELGNAMVTRNVVDAVNLDGGSSTALMVRGDVKIAPSRKLSNLVVLRDRAPMSSQVATMR